MPRLRVSAGPDPRHLTVISNSVNTNKSTWISSDLFEGQIVVNIKGFTDRTGRPTSSAYFDQDERQGITWSFQMQGRFLKEYSADDILFGNTFDRPLHLPWGSGAALKFMNFVDPTLEHDLTSSTRPWALSPLITTMPHFVHTRLGGSPNASPASSSSSLGMPSAPPRFPPRYPLRDDTSMLYLAQAPSPYSSASSSSSSLSSSSSHGSYRSSSSSSSKHYNALSVSRHKKRGGNVPINLQTASQRRSYFSSPDNRQAVRFGPNDIITTDFCYGFLEFSPTISLRIPGGLSFDLMRYWDGQPVFNGWAKQAGLDISQDSYNDLYSLDPEMLSMIPRPVKAVIFVFPYNEARYRRAADDERIAQQPGGNPVDPKVFWMHQTIRNACGAMAMVHSLANSPVTLDPKGPLSAFYASARALPPVERSKLFAATPEFATIHESVTTAGQCSLPDLNESVDQAYTAFVGHQAEKDGKTRVVELDGGRAGPVDCGEVAEAEGEDLLDAIVRIVKDDFVGKSGSVKFNMMYLGKPVGE
ncbi:hypothetical protein V5O48_005873 [Marasmius crinis-equi]|uniref:ubiquitinyl hydrolase 1 n=1 Tax=Marasmius crinis-equi TaxID=585013 RepID=A0ABR3FL52_9AGAR